MNDPSDSGPIFQNFSPNSGDPGAGQEAQRFCAQCPSSSMTKEAFGGVIIDVCQSCLGVWLDDGELQALVAEHETGFCLDEETRRRAEAFLAAVSSSGAELPNFESERAKALLCPVCDAVCFPTTYGFDSGVIINRCLEGHGIFFDPVELEAILVLTAMSREKRSPEGSVPVLERPGRMGGGEHRQSRRLRRPGALAQPLEESRSASATKPRLSTTRALGHPLPIDVRVTVTRTGTMYFESIRSPQGKWYRVKDGGTMSLPTSEGEARRFWVELENGGALVVRQAGPCFEWLLVGASRKDPRMTTNYGRA